MVWFRDEKKDKKLEFQGNEAGPDQVGGWLGIQRNWRERLGKGTFVGNYPGRRRRLCGPPSPHSDPHTLEHWPGWDWGHNKLWKSLQKQWKKEKERGGKFPVPERGHQRHRTVAPVDSLLRDNRKPPGFFQYSCCLDYLIFQEVKSLKILMK